MSAARLLAASLALAAAFAPSSATAQASASPYTSASRYDAMRRVTGTIAPDPDGAGALPFPAVRNTYDAAGRLIKVETGELAAWQSESVAPSAWSGFTVHRSVETTYDAMSRKVRERLREGAAGTIRTVTDYSYDLAGRLDCTALRMNAANFASPLAACTQGTGGADRIARNVYDAAGQRIQAREGVGTAVEAAEATWRYNLNGQVDIVIDANGNRAELRYDGHGRQDRWTFPSTTRASAYNDATQATALATAGSVNAADYEEYSYDPQGNRTNLRKRDGRNIAFAYDNLNRVTSKTYPQGGADPVYYSYDLRGLQLSARFTSQSGLGITTSYDGFGRVASSTTDLTGPAPRTLSYQYDRDGNRTRITHPDGAYFNSAYDGLDRPVSIADQTTTRFIIGYNGYGSPTGVLRNNGTFTNFGYDGLQRLNAYGMGHGFPGYVEDNLTLLDRNEAGQLSSVTINNNAYAWTGHYGVQRAYTTNGLNQYSAAGTAAFTYDANGNLTSDGTRTFTYDIENRLVAVSGGVQLGYDPLGRLSWTTGSPNFTRFLYDGDALVGEYDYSGAMTTRYVHNVGADVPVMTYSGTGLSTLTYLHPNHQGSIIAVSDGTGAHAINTYDEYGIPGAANTGRFQYTGQIWLPEIGMYHYKARVYSPTLGRFLQTDPIGYQDQFNLYAYVGNDPINGVDPSGKRSCSGFGDCILAAAETVVEVARPAAAAVAGAAGVVVGAQVLASQINNSTPREQTLAGDSLRHQGPQVQNFTRNRPNSSDYEVRVQVQGHDLEEEQFDVIRGSHPTTPTEVIGVIQRLVGQLPRRERRAIEPAVRRAERGVRGIGAGGGLPPGATRPYGTGTTSRSNLRIDIENQGKKNDIIGE